MPIQADSQKSCWVRHWETETVAMRQSLAPKFGCRTGNGLTDSGLSYRHIIASAEASLKQLGTDYIDLYQLHIPDPLTPPEETVRALGDLKDER